MTDIPPTSDETLHERSFTLEHLTCESCVKLCALRFRKIEGVCDVAISLTDGHATVRASRPVALEELASALEGTHYTIAHDSPPTPA